MPANLFELNIILELNYMIKPCGHNRSKTDHFACCLALCLTDTILCSKFANKNMDTFGMRACHLTVLFLYAVCVCYPGSKEP